MTRTLYLKSQPGDIAELVLLTGDPARVARVAEMLDQARTVAQNREFYASTGLYQGIGVTVASSGIGAPSAAIAIEELAQLGAKAIVRLGTTMGVMAPLGGLMLSTGAARYEGTSPYYLPIQIPAVPDWHLAQALYSAARRSELTVSVGLTSTHDAFYPDMAPALMNRPGLDFDALARAQIQALDMETSLIFILCNQLRIAGASLCLVTNSANPFAVLEAEARSRGEQILIQTALDGLLDWKAHHG